MVEAGAGPEHGRTILQALSRINLKGAEGKRNTKDTRLWESLEAEETYFYTMVLYISCSSHSEDNTRSSVSAPQERRVRFVDLALYFEAGSIFRIRCRYRMLSGTDKTMEGGRMTRFRIINWWIARKLEGFHILLAAGGSLACLTGIAAEQPAVSRGGGIFLLCLAVVVLIHENLHRFWDYLENHQDLDRLPAGQMKQVNLFLLLCFLTVFLGFVFLAGFFPWKETGELLYAGIRTFFRFLASLFPKGEEEYEMGEGEAGQLLSGMEFLEGGGENDPFWEMVSYVFAAVTAVGFGLFLLYLLVRKIAEYLGSLTF